MNDSGDLQRVCAALVILVCVAAYLWLTMVRDEHEALPVDLSPPRCGQGSGFTTCANSGANLGNPMKDGR